MLVHIGVLVEIISIIICINCVFGKKIRLDKNVGILILLILAILEFINHYQISALFSLLTYVLLFIYALKEFKKTVSRTIINFIIFVVVFISLQYVVMTFVEICISRSVIIRNLIGNIIVLFVCMFGLPRCRIDRISKGINSTPLLLMPFLLFMSIVIGVMLLQMKLYHKVQTSFFVFAIPAIIMMMILIVKWYLKQNETENLEKELRLIKESKDIYSDLLTKLRMRQHEIKNLFVAVLSSHYACDTYEELVKTQEKYCKKIESENRYNNLILLGDPILAAFLYRKFIEAEEESILIEYKVAAQTNKCSVKSYHMIEMLGILLDNAVEALKGQSVRKIVLEIVESDSKIICKIRNPYNYTSYELIEKWFEFENSTKGPGRGIGLYHLRCMCDELKCILGCRNITIKDMNWIMFILEIDKIEN